MVHPDHRRPLHLAFESYILTIGVPFTSPSKSEALYPRHAVPPRDAPCLASRAPNQDDQCLKPTHKTCCVARYTLNLQSGSRRVYISSLCLAPVYARAQYTKSSVKVPVFCIRLSPPVRVCLLVRPGLASGLSTTVKQRLDPHLPVALHLLKTRDWREMASEGMLSGW
jgi:hypothetical protein